ncbi:hypothetical protein [Bradyrhizobium sp. CCGUVB23]|uniref:hypothetical protein n=1 Tax=Bradyrhizobium sp. CCGUVB23 TaxID=2949630 RepID=UPI0020B27934|nr:hypothetical protein [Bradyrhizobium sp. CCGUVB23]MCP3459194.1 hypothetical protein [Bradyrhizobium sp. CCGUVB23]
MMPIFIEQDRDPNDAHCDIPSPLTDRLSSADPNGAIRGGFDPWGLGGLHDSFAFPPSSPPPHVDVPGMDQVAGRLSAVLGAELGHGGEPIGISHEPIDLLGVSLFPSDWQDFFHHH